MDRVGVEENVYDNLRSCVQVAFGRRISTAKECAELSDKVYHKTCSRINVNTLRRFFGVVKAKHKPSKQTTDLLLNYCGCKSIENLRRNASALNTGDTRQDEILIFYLTGFFRQLATTGNIDDTLVFIEKKIIDYLSKIPVIAEKLHAALAKIPAARRLYFEQLVNTNQLNGYYGEGLKYYIAESSTNCELIFGYAVLCMRDWLNGDYLLLSADFNMVKKAEILKGGSPHYTAWYYAAHLFFLNAGGHGAADILGEIQKLLQRFKKVEKNIFFSFHYPLARALVFTGHYEKALQLLAILHENSSTGSAVRILNINQEILLLTAFAHCQAGNTEMAAQYYQLLVPASFNFLSSKLDMILYLVTEKQITTERFTKSGYLADLISETGFKTFQKFIN